MYELEHTTRVDRDFMEKLPLTAALLCEPFAKVVTDGRKMRITIDYDPADSKITFSYYRPNSAPDQENHQ